MLQTKITVQSQSTGSLFIHYSLFTIGMESGNDFGDNEKWHLIVLD